MNKNSCRFELTQSSNSRIVKYLTKTTQLYSNIKYPNFIQNMIFALNFMVFSLQTLVTILVEQNSFKFQSQRQKFLVFDFLTNDLRLKKSCLFVYMYSCKIKYLLASVLFNLGHASSKYNWVMLR